MILERRKAGDALEEFLGRIEHRTGEEVVETLDAVGRVLAEDVRAEVTLPPFDRAAMDGYAVRAEDTFGASFSSPVILNVTGSIETGENPDIEVGRGEAVRIATGAVMPAKANAVVMVEYTSEGGSEGGVVEVYRAVAPGENVSKRGEDVREGEIVLERGEVIQPHDVGLLLAVGAEEVKVAGRVRAAVAATGDEICDARLKAGVRGKVPDTNRPSIISSLKALGCDVADLGIVRDSREEMRRAFEKALDCDLVIFTGATSAGEKDIMPEILEEFGEVIAHGIAIKPGMPTALGIVDGKPVILLPGFPVACLIAFRLFAIPAIWRLQGTRIVANPGEIVKARLARRIASSTGTRTFTRVRLERRNGEFIARPMRTSGSGVLSSLVRAHGFVEVEEELEGIEEGKVVEVKLTRHLVLRS